MTEPVMPVVQLVGAGVEQAQVDGRLEELQILAGQLLGAVIKRGFYWDELHGSTFELDADGRWHLTLAPWRVGRGGTR